MDYDGEGIIGNRKFYVPHSRRVAGFHPTVRMGEALLISVSPAQNFLNPPRCQTVTCTLFVCVFETPANRIRDRKDGVRTINFNQLLRKLLLGLSR